MPPFVEKAYKIYFGNMTLEYFLTSFLGTKDSEGSLPVASLFSSTKRNDFIRRIAPLGGVEQGYMNTSLFNLATTLYRAAYPMSRAAAESRLTHIFTQRRTDRPHFYEVRFDLFALYIMHAKGQMPTSFTLEATPVYSKSHVIRGINYPEIFTTKQIVYPYRRLEDTLQDGMTTVSLKGEKHGSPLLTMQGILVHTKQDLRDIYSSGQIHGEFTYSRMACTIPEDSIVLVQDILPKVAYATIKGRTNLVFIEQGPLQVNNIVLRLYECEAPRRESGLHNSMLALSIMLSTQYTSMLSQHAAHPTSAIEIQEGYGADFPINLKMYPFGMAVVLGIRSNNSSKPHTNSKQTLILALDTILKLPRPRAYACMFAVKLFQSMSALTHGLIYKNSAGHQYAVIEDHFKRMYGIYVSRVLMSPHDMYRQSPMEAVILNEAGIAILHTVPALLEHPLLKNENDGKSSTNVTDPIVVLGLQLFSTFSRLQQDRIV